MKQIKARTFTRDGELFVVLEFYSEFKNTKGEVYQTKYTDVCLTKQEAITLVKLINKEVKKHDKTTSTKRKKA